MKKLITRVLDKYNTRKSKISHAELAELIIAHMKVGIDGKKGWYLDLNNYNGQYERDMEMIEEYS